MKLWAEVRRRVLTKEISKRAACKEYGLGWDTLAKILAHDEPPGYRQSVPRRKPKLEPFLPIIYQILEDDRQAPRKQRHTAHRIFQRLRDEHGYDGGETIVKDAVREWKQSGQEVFLVHPAKARAEGGGPIHADRTSARARQKGPPLPPSPSHRSHESRGEGRCDGEGGRGSRQPPLK